MAMVQPNQPPLRLIGYWVGPMAPGWPDPRAFVDETWDAGDRDVVIEYLSSGFTVRAFGGVSTCRFCGRDNGAIEVSDGTWTWPEGLAHYLAEHGVRLPEEFVQHVFDQLDRLHDAGREMEWWRSRRTLAAGND
jgi:hypothetical protein